MGYYNLAAGELPPYGLRLLSARGLAWTGLKLFLVLGFLWAGVWLMRRGPFCRRAMAIIALVVVAGVLGSSQVIRPLVILCPMVLPGYLVLLEE